MHLVTKRIKGGEYYYLVQKERQGQRVVTARTVYVGDRQKLASLIEAAASSSLPATFTSQEVGASLALASLAGELGLEQLIDEVCPRRVGAVSLGRRLLVAAIHRATAPKRRNSLMSLRAAFESSALADLLPLDPGSLDNRRMCEALASLSPRDVEAIESAVVKRVVEREGLETKALAFDCSNFDSYAEARTPSRLLRRGHNKSGKPLRVLGLGVLVTEEDGIPLLTFAYPGNENDVTAFGRFLMALDRRRDMLDIPFEATVAADGGNISRQMLLRLEKGPRYYVLRLPSRHVELPAIKSADLPALGGTLKGKVYAQKHTCNVYGIQRCVLDVYSKRMHRRQLPGLKRDRDRARKDLEYLQRLLNDQAAGKRKQKPLTVAAVKRRVEKALSREHMTDLFVTRVEKGRSAPILTVEESTAAWRHLEEHVLGRTRLVTNRADWSPEQIVHASRVQSHNESLFRELKDPGGVSMLPLRHRRDKALRGIALVVVLGLMLAKVTQRRLRLAKVAAPSLSSLLDDLRAVQRAQVQYGPDAPPALRSLAVGHWIPSQRTERQARMLEALKLAERRELGTTLASTLSGSSARRARRRT